MVARAGSSGSVSEPLASPSAGTVANEVPAGPAVYRPPVVIDALPHFIRRAHEPRDRASLIRQEWLLTNGIGGYAMGTALGVNTRRYHSLLNAATMPPVGRINALTACVETLILEPIAGRTGMSDHAGGEQRLDFTTFCFHGEGSHDVIDGHLLHPSGYLHLETFEKTPTSCMWCYRYGPVEVRRELTLVEGQNAAIIRYSVSTGGHRARFEIRPLVAMRDIHALQTAGGGFASIPGAGASPSSVEIDARGNRLLLECIGSGFEPHPEWWYGLEYPKDRARGQEYREDLFTPGVFVAGMESGARERVLEFKAVLSGSDQAPPRSLVDNFAGVIQRRRTRLEQLVRATGDTCTTRGAQLPEQDAAAVGTLVCAADQFVVRRDLPDATGARTISSASVIAGYPWFADWGRDTMISLRGLFLTTGRLDEARQCLQTFARLRAHGLVPNCFHDSGEVEHNTVDASLWYIHAACDWRREAARAGLPRHDNEILGACVDIVKSYIAGTDFDIKVDPTDGLVAAGNVGTQLTWMDAKRDGVVFTPRHGKPVEINALWYSALLELSDALQDSDDRLAAELKSRAHVVAKNFREHFWDDTRGCLYDVLLPGIGGVSGSKEGKVWWPSPEVRSNQIWAVSLPHSPLTDAMQKSVVRKVGEALLTPMGLRTLAPGERGYATRFEGSLFERDRAYHNGTVWPWLIGAYAEAVLRVGGFSARSAADARRAIAPLLDVVTCRGQAAELGQIPEIYDADESPAMPRRADGCPMQAWSVAETLRVLWMILRIEAGVRPM